MSPEQRAHLNAIILNPADDVPRLVYADRLDDWGENERAEFIRVQCETAKHPKDSETCLCGYEPFDGYHHNRPTCPYALAAELLMRNWHEWSGRHGTYCLNFGHTSGAIGIGFHRGLVSELQVSTLATWMGGECGECGGTGRLVTHYTMADGGFESETCPACQAIGRTPGIGRLICESNPVEWVEVGDKTPFAVLLDMGEAVDYAYFSEPLIYEVSEDPEAVQATIPEDLWLIYMTLKNGKMHTEQEAKECLSRAMIQIAREPLPQLAKHDPATLRALNQSEWPQGPAD